MTKTSKLKIVFLLSIFYFLFFVASTKAAEIYLESPFSEFMAGDRFEVGFYINAEGEEINALSGKVVFPNNLLEFKEFRDGSGIVNFWIEKPNIQSDGGIVFSGIIPGGYNGEKGLIFSAIFQLKQEGEGTISFSGIKVLLNDGQGSETTATTSDFKFLILKKAEGAANRVFVFSIRDGKDDELPEDFKPEIGRSSEIFEGRYFLVFATQDKNSGIARYEIREIKRWIGLENLLPFVKYFRRYPWIIAESPYLLKDQKLKSYIYVKAVDKSGNERIAVVEPRYPTRWYEKSLVWVIILMTGIIAYLIWVKLKNK